jgi:hypothetical protein
VVATRLGFLVAVVLIESEKNDPIDSVVLELVTGVLLFGETRLHRLLPQHRIICALDLKPFPKGINKTLKNSLFIFCIYALFFCLASAPWKADII